jgi:hypothetical protein
MHSRKAHTTGLYRRRAVRSQRSIVGQGTSTHTYSTRCGEYIDIVERREDRQEERDSFRHQSGQASSMKKVRERGRDKGELPFTRDRARLRGRLRLESTAATMSADEHETSDPTHAQVWGVGGGLRASYIGHLWKSTW